MRYGFYYKHFKFLNYKEKYHFFLLFSHFIYNFFFETSDYMFCYIL